MSERPTRMDEKWAYEQAQERAWLQSLADDPAWMEWNEQMNQQHQQEQDDGHQHTQL